MSGRGVRCRSLDPRCFERVDRRVADPLLYCGPYRALYLSGPRRQSRSPAGRVVMHGFLYPGFVLSRC